MKRTFSYSLIVLLVVGMSQFCIPPSAFAAGVWDGVTVDTSWYDSDQTSTTFFISTGAQLAGLARLTNQGDAANGNTPVNFYGKTIYLGDDIDLGNHPWTPIGYSDGSNSHLFDGTFASGGYAITNFYIGTSGSPENSLNYVGLFGYTDTDSTIEGLIVITSGIYTSFDGAYAGVLVGDAEGKIIHCSATGNISGGEESYVGGLAGTSEGDMQDSHADGNVSCGSSSGAGGLVGQKADGVLTGCYANGTVTGGAYAGGLVGSYSSSKTLSNCHAAGNVTSGGPYAGGFAGYLDQDASGSGCYSTGNVTASGASADTGGFAGYSAGILDSCFATGNVTNSGNGNLSAIPFPTPCCVGGFVGYNEYTITRCYAYGSVTSTGHFTYTGGFAGLSDLGLSELGTIRNCYAAGSVSGGNHNDCMIGGFIGNNAKDVQTCYARGAVSGSGTNTFVGAFAGGNDGSSTMGNCYFDKQDTGLTAGIGQDHNAQTITGLMPDKMTGTAASANLTGFDFSNTWATKANDSKWYFPQLAVFSSGSSTIRAYSLTSVTLTPFTVTFVSNGDSAVPNEYGYYSAVGKPSDPTKVNYFFDAWYSDSNLTTKYDFGTTVTHAITLYGNWTPVLALTLSPSDGKIYKGGRAVITPNIAGGTWDFDSAFLSQSGNEFTGLKVGTTTVKYTVGSQSSSVNITILSSELPQTGQNFTLFYGFAGLAALSLAAGTTIMLLRKRA